MRNGLVLALGLSLFAACGGDDDNNGDDTGSGTTPTASGVFPAESFAGRKIRVEISGDATTWADGATVSMGAGITVKSVTVASPTALFADIEIDAGAAAGLNDVTVTSGGTYTLTKAFEIKAPLDVQFQGDSAQGGLPYFVITNLDATSPFDVTTDSQTGEYINLAVAGPNGTTFQISSASAYEISGYAFIDGDAASGTLSVQTLVAGSVVESDFAVTIDPRTPTALTQGTTANDTIADIGDSLYYSLPTGGNFVHLSATSTDTNAVPVTAILDAGGHWHNQVGSSYAKVDNTKGYTAVVFDNGTAAGYPTAVTAYSETLTAVAEPTTNDNTTAGAVNASAFPFNLTAASLPADTDVDVIKVVVAGANVGKKLHVVTSGTDTLTDTALDIQTGGASIVDGPVDNQLYCYYYGLCTEDVTTDALAAGTYYIYVSAGAFYSTDDTDYEVLAWFE